MAILLQLTGIINKYNPMTILHELQWALSAQSFDDAVLIEQSGLYLDPGLKPGEKPQPKELVLEFRRGINQYFKQILSADLLIITLGMIECWLDNKTKLFLNQPPPPRAVKNDPDRYTFVVLDYEDVVDSLQQMYVILDAVGVKNIVITTSPVALARTFRNQDVITANCYSKSVLRAASEQFSEQHANVDYFPSYESVLYNDRNLSYQPDFAHASEYAVSIIIEQFLRRYVDGYEQQEIAEVAAEKTDNAEQLRTKKLLDRYKNLLIANKISF